MIKTVLITGGTGGVGKHLSFFLADRGYKVWHLSRKQNSNAEFRTFVWDIEKRQIDEQALQADAIIHLAGAGIIDRRWTKSYRKEILDSRIQSANLLFDAIKKSNKKPKVFLSASGVNYYGTIRSDVVFSEKDEPAVNDFTCEICAQWESSVYQFKSLGIRIVVFRLAAVLGKDFGVVQKLKPIFKNYLGSAIGDGKQYFPWIHIHDVCSLFLKGIEQETVFGVFNASSPDHTTNSQFSKAFAQALNRSIVLPNTPSWLLYSMLGKRADLLLKGSRISTKKLESIDFTFHYPKLEHALQNALRS